MCPAPALRHTLPRRQLCPQALRLRLSPDSLALQPGKEKTREGDPSKAAKGERVMQRAVQCRWVAALEAAWLVLTRARGNLPSLREKEVVSSVLT